MRTIAIINQKGGCGKTTTSINLAACLGRRGQKTLLVDMDPQGHCAVGLAVPEEQIERTIYDALIEESDGKPIRLDEAIWQIASDFDLCPSNLRLAAFEQIFAGRPGREDRLQRALSQVKSTYQWCIVDCPPSVGLITFNALRACDEVIVPVETGFFSLHGLAKMMETLEVLREQSGRDVPIRILPTLYDTRTKLAREILADLRVRFKDYLMESTVNFNTKLKEAASFGQPITEYDPGSRGYRDFANLARELIAGRPAEPDPASADQLSRPAELAQRAKQLAHLSNLQFGRNTITTQPSTAAPSTLTAVAAVAAVHGNGNGHANGNGNGHSHSHSHSNGNGHSAPAEIWSAATPTTDQKLTEFYGVRQMGDQVIFAARFRNADKVLVAGDFNDWSADSTPLVRIGRAGEFRTIVPMRPGRYRYRFIVDGNWVTDPNNAIVEANQFGEMNNVIEVR